MNIRDLAKRLAIENRLPRADRYDLFLREFDNKVEVVGWVQDPTADMRNYVGREMLFPKRWETLGIFDGEMRIKL